VDEMEVFLAWEVPGTWPCLLLFASLPCSRESAIGGLCDGLLFDGLLLILLDLEIEVGVVESRVDNVVVVVVAVAAAAAAAVVVAVKAAVVASVVVDDDVGGGGAAVIATVVISGRVVTTFGY
jgi:hypothetical protein